VDTISNAIIVSDRAEQVAQVRRLIKRLDVHVPQVTVHLRYDQATTSTRSLSTAGGISGGRGGLQMSSSGFNQQKNLQLTVSSGSSGYLLVGRDIPFTSAWLELCYGHGYRFSWLTQYQRVSSGFEVQPVVIGSRVDLLLVPRLSFANRQEISFSEAATRITVPTNTWVTAAAADFNMNSVSAAILTANGQTNSRAMVMEVMVSVR
jgi:type II secretory pathway component GspD/PulD (secretin)